MTHRSIIDTPFKTRIDGATVEWDTKRLVIQAGPDCVIWPLVRRWSLFRVDDEPVEPGARFNYYVERSRFERVLGLLGNFFGCTPDKGDHKITRLEFEDDYGMAVKTPGIVYYESYMDIDETVQMRPYRVTRILSAYHLDPDAQWVRVPVLHNEEKIIDEIEAGFD